MSDMPNPNTANEKTDQELSLNLEKSLEQSSELNPNPEQAQSSDTANLNTSDENLDQELNLNVDPTPKSTLAMLCLIGALIGLIPLIPPIVNIAAIIMGHAARSSIRQDSNESGSGVALVGLILSYIGWLTGPILLTFTMFAFSSNWSANIEIFFKALIFGSGSVIGR